MKTSRLPRTAPLAPNGRMIAAKGLMMTTVIAAGLAGCASNAQGVAVSNDVTARLIVRFKSPAADPTDPTFLARLAAAANVSRVEFVRPMSGDAFVMTIACAGPGGSDPNQSCPSAIARLRATDAVRDVEIDAREKHQ